MLRPQDCIIAFAIPISLKEYDAYPQDTEGTLFLNKHLVSELKYYYDTVKVAERNIKAFRSLGVRVLESVTSRQFIETCTTNQNKLIILFAHWCNDSVEFSDGFCPIQTIIDQFPGDFSGYLDLNVCHPDNLVDILNTKARNAIIKFESRKNATPSFWLQFYLIFFKVLENTENYLEAYSNSIAMMGSNLKASIKRSRNYGNSEQDI